MLKIVADDLAVTSITHSYIFESSLLKLGLYCVAKIDVNIFETPRLLTLLECYNQDAYAC